MILRNICHLLIATLCLTGCRILVAVPEGGFVTSNPGNLTCEAGSDCSIEVEGFDFAETFTAVPDPGYLFTGWQRGYRGLCGGSLGSCVLDASFAVGHPALSALIESDEEFYLTAQFLPEDEVRRYVAGDVALLEGALSETQGMSPEVLTEVTARLKILPTELEQETMPVSMAELVVWGPGEERLLRWTIQFWQDDVGGIHLRTDEYGNLLLNTATNTTGLTAVPVPLEPFASEELTFSAMWGGHTSTPLTSGSREIETGEPVDRQSPAGDLMAYPVTVVDEFTYLVSYADYKRDQSISREQLLWISQAKGLTGLDAQQSVYDARGALLSTRRLTLEAVKFKY